MPLTTIIFYAESNGKSPVVDWLSELKLKNRQGFANCIARIRQLQQTGYQLRRPSADYLRDGIYELRARHQKVQYRILYFFNGKDIAVLSHSIIKKTSAVPNKDIDIAIKRKKLFIDNPQQHTYQEDISE